MYRRMFINNRPTLVYNFTFLKVFLILVFLFFAVAKSFGQEMQQGFNFLEKGNYKEAIVFFEKVLQDYPTNKTAQLCYARAVGLNGDATKAQTLFSKMLVAFPNDFEVELNYAESLLWGNLFDKAKIAYEDLLAKDSANFSAVLGYANTLSNLKKYEDALAFVTKALEISPGNPNALVSKKYIHFGLASTYVSDKKYEDAIKLLRQNFSYFENDVETLLNLTSVYIIAEQFENAKEIYQTLEKIENHQLQATVGLSLVSHLQENDKNALQLATKAKKMLDTYPSENNFRFATERYIQALIWNKKYKNAAKEINKLEETHADKEWVLALKAMLNVYLSKFKNSISNFEAILLKNSTSFDGNLGIANSYYAIGNLKNAYDFAGEALKFYPNQKDIIGFINKLDLEQSPNVTTDYYYSFDNGNNIANAIQLSSTIPLHLKLKVFADFGIRTTSNTTQNIEAKTKNVSVGFGYKLANQLELTGKLGNTNSAIGAINYDQLLANTFLKISAFRLQNIEIGYKRDVQSFNADLLSREIVLNNYILNYSLSSTFGLGFFGQYYYTSQNDGNQSDLLFTSLYYNFFKKPILKVGVNYQYLGFQNQVPTIYFSPEKFNAIELFANLIKEPFTIKTSGVFYDVSVAAGIQSIEGNQKNTFRFATNLGYQFSKKAILKLFANQSNIASATAAGFKFTQIGINFNWIIGSKPIFK